MRPIWIVLSLLTLAACQAPNPQEFPQPQFTGKTYGLNAADMQVIEEFTPKADDPQIKYSAPTDLVQGVKLWAADRIRLMGTENRVTLTITDATMTETNLNKDESTAGVFKNEQASQLNGSIAATLNYYDTQHNLPIANVEMQATASTTLAENASFYDRQYAVNKLVNVLLQKLDEQYAMLIPQYFGPYLVPE
jgi:hypothetical protein